MQIIREKHPLQGQSLRVLGQMHRGGTQQLILSLPDGGTSLIPVAWTDVSDAAPLPCAARVLGRGAHLLHTRRVVDVLLQRLNMAGGASAEEENVQASNWGTFVRKVREEGQAGTEVARYLGVTTSCINRHVASGELSAIAQSIVDSWVK